MPEYLVFARDDVERALEHVGEVEAVDDGAARETACGQHTTPVEMILVPAEAVHWVMPPAVAAESGTTAAGSATT